jgi:nucleoside 2-deoxyribosyltransferase
MSLEASRLRGSRELSRNDYILGLFGAHEDITPEYDNREWSDERLRVPYNTLSHIIYSYNTSLWIKISELKAGLGLLTNSETRRSVFESTPQHVRSAFLSLMSDHEDYYKNCFLIMPFRESALHREVRSALELTLAENGLNLLRADDREYSDNLFTNIEAYMCGCRIGIAIHERVYDDTHNANVALEVGYMLGQGKDVCLLKEKTVKSLPSDLQGRLYREFDAERTTDSVATAISGWISDKRIRAHGKILPEI